MTQIARLLSLIEKITGRVSALEDRPLPRDGVSPDPEAIARLAAGLVDVPTPRDGKDADPYAVAKIAADLVDKPRDGRDGVSPDPKEVAAHIAPPRDGRDGRDGVSPDPQHVAKLTRELIPTPKNGRDGISPDPKHVATLVPRAKDGERGPVGPPGKSITSVKVNKKNELIVAIDGVPQPAGQIKLPQMTRTVMGVDGGGKAKRPRVDGLGWDANYFPGKDMPELTAVFDDGWTMVSNKATSERAAPEPTGPEKQLFNGTLVPEQDTAKQVLFGTRLTVQQAGYILSYRVDVVAGNSYQVFLVEDPLGTKIVSDLVAFTAPDTGWQEFNIQTALLLPGATFDLVALASEPDPTPTTFNGNWDYRKPGGGGGTTQPPDPGEIVHPNNLSSVMRVHKTDDDGGDRSAELATLTVGDTIEGQGIRWAIQDIVDDGTYFSYGVAPAAQAQDQGVFNFVFETVTATPITFGRDAGYWDGIGATNIRGLLAIDEDYDDAQVLGDAFGVDFKVQLASISDDWDLMASSQGASGSGGLTEPVSSLQFVHDQTPNPPYSEGATFYDSDKKALSYYNSESDTTVNIAQELLIQVCNQSGGLISNGQAVRAVSAVGDLPCVELAVASSVASAEVAGVATHDIPDGETGFITAFGSVGGVDTSAFAPGAILYIDATTPGVLTDEEQEILNPVAFVLTAAVEGAIFARPRGVVNLTATTQVLKAAGAPTQDITATPSPVAAYTNAAPAPLVNTVVNFTADSGQFQAEVAPATAGASGFYHVGFSVSGVHGSNNQNVIFTLYVGGSPTEVICILPFDEIDNNGTASSSFSAITPVPVTPLTPIEMYVQTDGGGDTITYSSCVFNVERLGNA